MIVVDTSIFIDQIFEYDPERTAIADLFKLIEERKIPLLQRDLSRSRRWPSAFFYEPVLDLFGHQVDHRNVGVPHLDPGHDRTPSPKRAPPEE